MNLLKQQLILQMQEDFHPKNYNLSILTFVLNIISIKIETVKHFDYLLDDLNLYYCLPYEDREKFLEDVLEELTSSSAKNEKE
jgi:hypothetical protein